ncbi:MAG: NAD(P)H-hydrate dehydratase [Bacteroidota bacterium]|nr:NAD(P)H-hydrate dehydratase [Bacteroidota bacterium]
MKLLTAKQIQDWDAFTIKHEPISSVDLMERASKAFSTVFLNHLNEAGLKFINSPVFIFCGLGNNGGDGLAIARILHEAGKQLTVYVLNSGGLPSPDFTINFKRLKELREIEIIEIDNEKDLPNLPENAIIIDALFGTGLNKPLAGITALLVQRLNETNGYKVSVDIPSGLLADLTSLEMIREHTIFKAHDTFTFQVPKQSFMFPETGEFVGNFKVLTIGLHPDFLKSIRSDSFFISKEWVQANLKSRSKFSHKGSAGHALIIAGSYGKMGAALLASKAALRAGCGLLTAYIPRVGYTIFQTAFPEAMVQTDEELYEIRNFPSTNEWDAIGVGPGMGVHPNTVKAFGIWLNQINIPLLIDADGLNACAELMKLHADFSFPNMAVITPHPKEFERLAGKCTDSFERLTKQKEFAHKHNVIVVLKGAHTCITLPDGETYFNLTGNPLLATAGSGDVLSGIITSFLAQGYEPKEAALLGVYLHGTLANRLKDKGYKQAVAGDLIEELKFI